MVTISAIKADIGGFPGHRGMHPDLVKTAEQELGKALKDRLLIDFRVLACGDDLQLIMTHDKGVDCEAIHKLAWDTFIKGTEVARKLKLYGAGQDLLKDTFSGNVKGMGPGSAEMEIEERKSEPIVVFMADKTNSGAWNFPLYKIFADPFNSIGLVIAPEVHNGFDFEVWDIEKHTKVMLRMPEDIYDLLVLIGSPDKYVVKRVFNKKGEIAAVTSTDSLHEIAGGYVGKDDPVMIVRSQSQFPAFGEVLEPFAFPYLVKGWMRGSHHGPFMPTCFKDANPSRFDGPPRVIAAGFQLAKGKLVGPVDLFADPSFDRAREQANVVADYLRRHGPFEPHRLGIGEMEYTTMPKVMEKLKGRFKPVEGPGARKK